MPEKNKARSSDPRLEKHTPTPFMLSSSLFDPEKANRAVRFIESLKHTKGRWEGKPFLLLDWQFKLVSDVFGVIKEDGTRQFRTVYVEIPKKNQIRFAAAAM